MLIENMCLQYGYSFGHQGYFMVGAPMLHDQEKSSAFLERYFSDLYKMFLMKLNDLDCRVNVTIEQKKKIKGLVDELIRVRGLINTVEEDRE